MPITFTPVQAPTSSTARAIEIDRREARFRNYVQRTPGTSNPVKRRATLVWSSLTPADADSIEAELLSAWGADVILYAVPPDTTVRKWICNQWTRSEPDQVISALTVEFEEVYDP